MASRDKLPQTRPHRGLGRAIVALVHCPVCQTGGARDEETGLDDWGKSRVIHPADTPVRVVRYRTTGVLLECPACGVRFSVPLSGDHGLGSVLDRTAAADVDGLLRLRSQDPSTALTPVAAERLEQRGRDEGGWGRTQEDPLDWLRLEALKQVARRFRNAASKIEAARENSAGSGYSGS